MSDAIIGTFVNIKTMADGTPRVILDLQCTLAEIAALGLEPGAPFALARLKNEATQQQAQQETTKEKPGELCVMACNFCKDPDFWVWIDGEHINSENHAKNWILYACRIASRKELDTNSWAASTFHRVIRQPFLEWKSERNKA